MRYRVLAVVAAAVALSVVAATTAKSSKAAGHTLTVWLQVDAQNGWPDIVAAANHAFENSHPGWNVNVQYQQWSDHLQKFDATIAGNDTPDVIEMGNTEMTEVHGRRRVREPRAVQGVSSTTRRTGSRA